MRRFGMSFSQSRRRFLRDLGVGAAVSPLIMNLPSLAFANQAKRKQRLVVIFSPNGIVPDAFWPDEEGENFKLKTIMEPLAPLQDKTLVLKGVSDRVRGDGDSHMRGIGCLLTGIELFAGNIQGGSDTPAGWASGLSIDQEIKNFLRQDPATQTRFGSLEFGVLVPERADTWTRMVYTGPNKPVAPVGDAYQMFNKLYGQMRDRKALGSVLDGLQADLQKVSAALSADDRRLLDEQTTFVRGLEQELRAAASANIGHPAPEPEPGVENQNDNMPTISKMQIELMVNSFVNDFTRVATLQYTNSVGGAKMRWIGIDDGHHGLSHEPDSNKEAMEKLTKINRWFCEQMAYLAQRLAETPEPGGGGSLLDNTLIVWTNELGKGSSHTLDDIPFVLVGGGLDFRMGRSLKFDRVPHNRLLLSLAHGFGHRITKFGNPDFCGHGPLSLS
jgi:hypothetical protein